jgi:hypothetical protein
MPGVGHRPDPGGRSPRTVSRGQNVDSFRFFPTIYDDGLRHSNYAGTYPRQKSVTGAGTIPARTGVRLPLRR